MFEKIKNYMNLKSNLQKEEDLQYEKEDYSYIKDSIYKSLDHNVKSLKEDFWNSVDVKFREFKLNDQDLKACMCYIETLQDKRIIDEHITQPLMENSLSINEELISIIKTRVSSTLEVSESSSMRETLKGILNGFIVLFIDGYDKALIFNVIKYETRGIEEPNTETQVRGPREGFIEEIHINSSLIRRKIRDPNLVFESLIIGNKTQTEVRIVYIKGIADDNVVNEVRTRLNRITVDSILDSGYVEQFIEDNPLSPFPTIGNSERPDKVAGKLLEGRVGIICDGTPFVLTVPFLFIENIQMGEDYYSRPFYVAFVRLLRMLAFFTTTMTPALYIALTSFNPDMLPTTLLITTAASREGVPFPAVLETVIMITTFYLLRESGLRLPKPIAQTLSIIGVLIMGETAVRAGIIGSTMLIIGALTGISSFVIAPLLDAIVIYEGLLIIASSILGFYGIVLVLIAILAHMCSLSSFGVPYLAPIAPTVWSDLKDTFIRMPLWIMKLRPKSLRPQNLKRQSTPISKYFRKRHGGEDN